MEPITPMGFRDFSTQEAELRRWMWIKIEETFRRYGYRPLETPAVEFLKLLIAKSGEEIKEQIFVIEGEEIGLRFEHTISLARYVAANLELPKPFKRYAIGKVWRNEEAQKGRYREFIQADVDVVGVREPTAEVELLMIAKEALEVLGFDVGKGRFLINHRGFLSSLGKRYGVGKPEFFRAIDKMDKIGEEGVRELLKKEGKKAIEAFEELKGTTLEDVKRWDKKAYEELSFITSQFPAEFSPTLVRGLDYYTGSVFEVRLSDEIGSVAGGGRYDGLTSIFGVENPAVGISLGFERLFYLLRKEKKIHSNVVYVAFIGENYSYAMEVAKGLRERGVDVDMNYSKRSLKAQLSYAEKMGYRWVVIVGNKEREEGSVVLRDMVKREEEKVGKEEVWKRVSL